MKKSVLVFILMNLPIVAFAKEEVSTDSFNQMISEGNVAERDIRTKTRNITSTGGATFKGEVITVVDSKRNPVKYNPFIEDDDVEVKSVHEAK